MDVLEELMESAESEPVRLKASTEILDRAGLRGGQDINIDMEVTEGRPAAQIVLERLARLQEGAAMIAARALLEEQNGQITSEDEETEEVVEAELVQEEPELQLEETSEEFEDLEAEAEHLEGGEPR